MMNKLRLLLDRQTPTTKRETLPKGVGVAKFDFTKTFRNQLFSRVWVLYHQYSITNHSESILKSKLMSILMIIFVVVVVFLSDLLRNILKCNCSPYSTLMTKYLLSDFINLTQVHNFTVSAQDLLPSVVFRYLP